jgi:hypothetical protein
MQEHQVPTIVADPGHMSAASAAVRLTDLDDLLLTLLAKRLAPAVLLDDAVDAASGV